YGRSSGILLVRFDALGQAAAEDELHRKVALAIVLADLVNRDDSGMVEQRHRFSFVLKTAQLIVTGQDASPDPFERDRPIQAALPAIVDATHSPAAKLPDDLIIAEVSDSRTRNTVCRVIIRVKWNGSPIARCL